MWEHDALGAGCEQIVADHHRIEMVIGQGLLQHLVRAIAAEVLGKPQKPELALLLPAPGLRQEALHHLVVEAGLNPVKLEHVEILHAEPAQALVERLLQHL